MKTIRKSVLHQKVLFIDAFHCSITTKYRSDATKHHSGLKNIVVALRNIVVKKRHARESNTQEPRAWVKGHFVVASAHISSPWIINGSKGTVTLVRLIRCCEPVTCDQKPDSLGSKDPVTRDPSL
jgi:hypothetical protein